MNPTLYSIGILCPTRKRPDSLRRFIESVSTMAVHPERCTFHFLIDDDDDVTREYLEELRSFKPAYGIKYQIHPRNSVALSDMWNKLYQTCDDDIVMICGDDAVMRSNAWDMYVSSVFDQIPDKIALVFGKDGIHNEKFAAQFFLHRNWIETAGYIFPPYYTADWADTWVFDVSQLLKRSFFVESIYLEHMHWSVGKSQPDETTRLAQARRSTDNNEAKFHSPEHFAERLDLVKKLYNKIWSLANQGQA